MRVKIVGKVILGILEVFPVFAFKRIANYSDSWIIMDTYVYFEILRFRKARKT